jgi:hypothetical protein
MQAGFINQGLPSMQILAAKIFMTKEFCELGRKSPLKVIIDS